MGLERQGWTVAFSDDIDLQKYEMYKGHFPDAASHYMVQDIHTVSSDSVPSITLATASFPCNDLSLAGARKGLAGKQSSAFWGFVGILERMGSRRPPIVLLENVIGFLNSHGGDDFRQALAALDSLGYSVDSFALDAIHFVPQSRPRLFVVGLLESCFGPNPDQNPEPAESAVRPRALCEFMRSNTDLRWRIRRLPPQPTSVRRFESVVEDLPDNAPEWWDRKRSQYLLDQMSDRHRKIANAMITGSEWSYGTVFRRMRNGKSMGELRTDGFAGCLRTPRGGSGRQILFKAGKGEYHARLVTPREAARLMGADDYEISVPLNQALFAFGDAVCVPVIEWIAEHYLNPMVVEMIRGRPLKLAVREVRV
ncbi:MAG: DNA (cytosine-5-)-methyltransferase [Dehalococcoidia bacterium]|nr:DNA (cytosine-5-)-methyltransferase [Dehalococcoidia bacterium]